MRILAKVCAQNSTVSDELIEKGNASALPFLLSQLFSAMAHHAGSMKVYHLNTQ